MKNKLDKFVDLFEVKNGRTFIKQEFYETQEAQAVRDAIFETCSSISTLDWLYQKASEIIHSFKDYERKDPDELDEVINEISDNLVDVYNSDRTAWLASDINFAAWCDEACEEYDTPEKCGILERIGIGQYKMIYELANNLAQKINEL